MANWYKKHSELLTIILSVLLAVPLIITMVQGIRIANGFDEMLGRSVNRGNKENILKMMEEVDSIYAKYYVGESISDQEIEDGMLKGLEWAYKDPYGAYKSPEETEEFLANQNEMLLGGIGVQSRFENNMKRFGEYRYSYYITHVYSGPARDAGIKQGDRIVEVESEILNANNPEDVLDKVRGDKGTKADLVILRENEEDSYDRMEFTLVRGDIINESIFTEILQDDIGYIVINTFSNKTDEELEQAIKDFKAKGIEKYILDVRNNSGGMADTVVRMLDMMLPEGLIASMTYKESTQNEDFYSDKNEIDGQFVCLINESSVSASELFAKALQEYGKATLVGELTYGKGTIVGTKTLSNGGSITLSIGEYLTKSGDIIENKGVEPDIEVSIPDSVEMYLYKLPLEEDLQLMKAVEILKETK